MSQKPSYKTREYDENALFRGREFMEFDGEDFKKEVPEFGAYHKLLLEHLRGAIQAKDMGSVRDTRKRLSSFDTFLQSLDPHFRGNYKPEVFSEFLEWDMDRYNKMMNNVLSEKSVTKLSKEEKEFYETIIQYLKETQGIFEQLLQEEKTA